ncbi:acyltransferase domain-containing protein [Paenibacillus sp. MSJ-34]|uniref:acyltransferase domain-containing protein n=1 Tax=Paenibacillus sp. MSJ-34 TaxID=2841529 RepID=UPI00209F924C|nr:acyltransferase domain-containing protein [Paenibacillus sp. MSJ-34]
MRTKMKARLNYKEYIAYCGFDFVPEGLEEKYRSYESDGRTELIPRDFLAGLFARYQIPEDTQQRLVRGIEAIEKDTVLFHFTAFLVEDMCSARNRCDEDFYTNMTPACMKENGELYSFLLLLACIVPSMNLLEKRGVPKKYYEDIPHPFLKAQFERLVHHGDPKVRDFPWVMNFYTCSIFLLDRFLFIPCRLEDDFTMFRHKKTQEVIALGHAGEDFRSDGQRNGINGVYDAGGLFKTIWKEDARRIVAHRMNPMGFVERETVSIDKEEWEAVLKPGDCLLALHIPSGPGYTPDRLRTSMAMAVEFYTTYFPELAVKGFWSRSWLFDPRLSLVLDQESNIVRVQRQVYNYPTFEGDGMLRYELFGGWDADPVGKSGEYTTSLQKAAAEYMKTGARFNTISMIVLKEEVGKIGSMPYITAADIEKFGLIVDSHMHGRKPNV